MGDMAELYDYDYDDEDFDQLKTCKYCGKTELMWDETPGLGWRLVNFVTWTPHTCEQYLNRGRTKTKHSKF